MSWHLDRIQGRHAAEMALQDAKQSGDIEPVICAIVAAAQNPDLPFNRDTLITFAQMAMLGRADLSLST